MLQIFYTHHIVFLACPAPPLKRDPDLSWFEPGARNHRTASHEWCVAKLANLNAVPHFTGLGKTGSQQMTGTTVWNKVRQVLTLKLHDDALVS